MKPSILVYGALAACVASDGSAVPGRTGEPPAAPAPGTPATPPEPMASDMPRGTIARGAVTVVWEATHGASGLPTATLLALDMTSGARLARETWVARPDTANDAEPALRRMVAGTGIDLADLRPGQPCAAEGTDAWRCGPHRVTVSRTRGPSDAACPEGARPQHVDVALDGAPLPARVRVDATCAVDATPASVIDDPTTAAAVVVLREQVPRHEGVGTAWAFALRAGSAGTERPR